MAFKRQVIHFERQSIKFFNNKVDIKLILPVCHRDIFLLLDYVQIRAVAL